KEAVMTSWLRQTEMIFYRFKNYWRFIYYACVVKPVLIKPVHIKPVLIRSDCIKRFQMNVVEVLNEAVYSTVFCIGLISRFLCNRLCFLFNFFLYSYCTSLSTFINA